MSFRDHCESYISFVNCTCIARSSMNEYSWTDGQHLVFTPDAITKDPQPRTSPMTLRKISQKKMRKESPD